MDFKKNNFKAISKFWLHFLFFSIFAFSFIIFYQDTPQSNQKTKGSYSTIEQIKIFKDSTLIIPKINVSAPIIWQVNGANKQEYFKALEGGVAHLKGTALPGQKSNLVIFGHSNFDKEAKGNYKKIFAHLNKLKEKDEITITFGGIIFKYETQFIRIVEPTDLWVIQPTPEESLTLLTCWPPGSIEHRLIVRAKRKTNF